MDTAYASLRRRTTMKKAFRGSRGGTYEEIISYLEKKIESLRELDAYEENEKGERLDDNISVILEVIKDDN